MYSRYDSIVRLTVDDNDTACLCSKSNHSGANHAFTKMRLPEEVEDANIPICSLVRCDLLFDLVQLLASKTLLFVVGVKMEF